MGYRKFKKGYRRNYGRRRKFKSGLRLKKIIRKTVMMSSETKFKINNLANVNVSNTVADERDFVNNIAQGTGNDQRIGTQIKVKNVSFDLTAYYFQNGTGNSVAGFLRVMLIWPRKGLDKNDVTLQFTASSPGVHQRPDPKRYIVLYDKKVLISSLSTGANGITYAKFKFSKYCKYMTCNYENDGTTTEGPILYIASDASSPGSAAHIINGSISTSFKDI